MLCVSIRAPCIRLCALRVDRAQMVSGVLIMTTYKLVVIPHRPTQSGVNAFSTGVMMDTSADERYAPFGHLPKEYLQVRRMPQGVLLAVIERCQEARKSAVLLRRDAGTFFHAFTC